jgi:hypothetical protein
MLVLKRVKIYLSGIKGSKLFGGLIGMMLTPKEAGATSTRRDNDITKMYKK